MPATISEWLAKATKNLKRAGISSARLDAELLLAYALEKDRMWLIAHSDAPLETNIEQKFDALLSRRLKNEPVAYMTGTKEFYGRDFYVNEYVLIPRPETEEMINLLKEIKDIPKNDWLSSPLLIDVGTGSGCIGLTAKLELPELYVWLQDISDEALSVAKTNFSSFQSTMSHADRVQFVKEDLLASVQTEYVSIVCANLPYVDRNYKISPDAQAEPEIALFANDNGYELIEALLLDAEECLLGGGYLLLESDPWQQDRIIKSAAACSLDLQLRSRFHLVFRRT